MDMAAPMKSTAWKGCTSGGEEPAAAEKREGEDAAQRERGGNAGDRHGGRTARVPPHQVGPELEADAEHVEDEPELADDEQDADRGGGKELRLEPGGQPAEKRRAHQEARHHFSHDLGLAGLPGEPANQPAHEQDDGQLQEEGGSQLRVSHEWARSGPQYTEPP